MLLRLGASAPRPGEVAAMNKDFAADSRALASGSRIVLVEARSLNRRLMVDWLKKAWPGCSVDAVATPAALDDDAGPVQLALFSFGHASIATAEVTTAIHELRRRVGAAPLVVLGEREDWAVVADALALGANGYVPTSFDALAAVRAIEFVLAGGTFVPAEVIADAGRRGTNGNGGQRSHEGEEDDDRPFLTPRERDVAARVCAGKPNKIIAHELQISEATVKVFVRHILSKFGATNRTEAASAIRRQLGSDEDLPGGPGSGHDRPVRRAVLQRAETRLDAK
jgi:DNA-binding NarL/FixJ family response regulator